MLKILMLGAGVQSSTVLLMSCKGVLPKLDGAVFADTHWEPKAVYAWLENVLEPEARTAGIPIHRVTQSNIRQDAMMRRENYQKLEGGRWASMPLYIMLNGKTGMLNRQCTKEYKIEPINRKLRELADGGKVQAWFGISGDEQRRVRMSKVRWIENYYPLIFAFERPYHRHHCLSWLAANGFQTAPRSACLGCPYHSDAEWRAIRQNTEEWADVLDFDAKIRTIVGVTADTYLHRSCKPLPMVDLETMEEKGQQNWLQECEGMCGV